MSRIPGGYQDILRTLIAWAVAVLLLWLASAARFGELQINSVPRDSDRLSWRELPYSLRANMTSLHEHGALLPDVVNFEW